MATTFINYNLNYGFYIAESFMQLAMYYIYTEAKNPQYIFSDKSGLLRDFRFKIDGIENPYFVLSWSSIFIDFTDEQTMITVLQNVMINLQNRGMYISLGELQEIDSVDFEFKNSYSRKPFPTSEIIKIIEALVQTMQGTWSSTNFSMKIDYRY